MPDPAAPRWLGNTLLPVLQALLPAHAAPRSPVNVRAQLDIADLWQWAKANPGAVGEALVEAARAPKMHPDMRSA